MDWGPGDFALAAILLIAAGLAWRFARTRVRTPRQRALIGLAILGALLLVWAEMAVGVFTDLGS